MDGSQMNYTQPDPAQNAGVESNQAYAPYPEQQYNAYPNAQYYPYDQTQYGYYPEAYDYAEPPETKMVLEVMGLIFGGLSALFGIIAVINFFAAVKRIAEAIQNIFSVFFNFGDILTNIAAIPVLSGLAVMFAIPAFIMKGVVNRNAKRHTALINVGLGLAIAGCVIGFLNLVASITVYVYIRENFMNLLMSTF
jgi:hypothetical protein